MPRTKSAWSYGFNDSQWTSNGLERPRTLSPLAGWPPQCFVNCGPTFGTYIVQRAELLSSNTADVSVNKAADQSRHATGVSGMIVTERLGPYSFGADPGSWTDWQVVDELVLDSNGTHSWSLLSPDISLDAHWLPLELYRFEGSSFSMDFVARTPAGASATPRVVDLGNDANRLRRAGLCGVSNLQESPALDPLSRRDMSAMMYSLRQRRSARSAPAQAPIRSRPSRIPENLGGAMKSTRDATNELGLKLPILEAEVLGLRQLLAEVKANRDDLRQKMDDLRRDRDCWQKLTEQAGPTLSGAAARRTWFCGRASPGNSSDVTDLSGS